MAQYQKWEYLDHLYIGPDQLNKLGSEGWEVVCTVGKDGNHVVLKRPVGGVAMGDEGAKKKRGYGDFI